MPRSVAEYLKHILDEVEYLDKAARGSSKNQFLEDETLKRSFVRSIEVIGEAIRKVPVSVRERHPDVQWRLIAGMRDKLIHHYLALIMKLYGTLRLLKYSRSRNKSEPF